MPVGNPPFGHRIGDNDFALDDLNADATHAANIGSAQRNLSHQKKAPAEAAVLTSLHAKAASILPCKNLGLDKVA